MIDGPDDKSKVAGIVDVESILKYIDSEEVFRFNDSLAGSIGMASTITNANGDAVTPFDSYTGLCKIIRSTEKGLEDCKKYMSFVNERAKNSAFTYFGPCHVIGLYNAASRISFDDVHLGSWIIGQVKLGEEATLDRALQYCRRIGADPDKFVEEFKKIQQSSVEDFEMKSEFLACLAGNFSKRAYDAIALKSRIREIEEYKSKVKDLCNDKIMELTDTINSLKDVCIRDSLTGCYNMRYLHEYLNTEFARSKRFGHDFSILMVDVDDFKGINDAYGHKCGDFILTGIVDIISSSIRNDIDKLVRYGGDEFLVIMPETSKDSAYRIAERTRTAVEKNLFDYKGISLRMTASLGIATFRPDAQKNVEDVIEEVDRVLYDAKKSGKNTICSY